MSDAPDLPPPPAVGPASFGRYVVSRREDGSLDELGRGAMGVTYRATDTLLRRTVVLKVVASALLGEDHGGTARKRFLREASAAAQLSHPNVAAVFDVGASNGEDFYVMEFAEGESLDHLVHRDGTLPWRDAVDVARQIGSALAAAARHQLVHRDIKPANVMAARDAAGRLSVKVIDFGLAKWLGGDSSTAAPTTTVSSPGAIIGTPAYASPEQLEGRELDARSDLYSLGVTLWYLLAGRPPFSGTTLGQVITGHLAKPPPLERLRAAQVPEPLVSLVARLLAKASEDRPQSAEEFLVELDRAVAATLAIEVGTAASIPAAEAPKQVAPKSITPELVAPEPPPPPPPPPVVRVGLVDVLRRRNVLPWLEALRVIEALAPVVDEGVRAGKPPLGLEPAAITLLVEGESVAELLDQPLDTWPPFLVELAPGSGTDLLGATMAPKRLLGAAGDPPARQLAALGYELLGGSPPSLRHRPLSAASEAANDVFRRTLDVRVAPPFDTATAFFHALRGASGKPISAAALTSPAIPAPPRRTNRITSSGIGSPGSTVGPPVTRKSVPVRLPPPPELPALPPPPGAPRRGVPTWAWVAAGAAGGLGVLAVLAPWGPSDSPRRNRPTPTPTTVAPPSPPPRQPTPTPAPTPTKAPARSADAVFEAGERARAADDAAGALREYQAAAAAGSVRAKTMLGAAMYYGIISEPDRTGPAVPGGKDYAAALRWLTEASDAGDGRATTLLAQIYLAGRGATADYGRAVTLAQRAADAGSPHGQTMLALLHANGLPFYLAQSCDRAADLIRRAAPNSTSAQAILGYWKVNGNCVQQDLLGGLRDIRDAEAKGSLTGAYYLGMCYANSLGVPRNDERAVALWRTAARGGYEGAEEELRRRGLTW